MLTPSHTIRLVGIALVLWALATACIRFWPQAFLDSKMGALGFAASLPLAFLSVWLTRKLAGLRMSQLLSGVALVGGIAMTVDGLALRFWPCIYGTDDTALRLGAAWLLWGYGASLGITLLWILREPETRSSR